MPVIDIVLPSLPVITICEAFVAITVMVVDDPAATVAGLAATLTVGAGDGVGACVAGARPPAQPEITKENESRQRNATSTCRRGVKQELRCWITRSPSAKHRAPTRPHVNVGLETLHSPTPVDACLS